MATTLSCRRIGHTDRRPTARALALLTVLVLLTLGMAVASPAPTARAATGDVGVEGLSHSGTGTPTGTKRAESVLWWNDGSWWGNLWDTVSGDFHIFRLDTTTQKWVDTGVTTETRANTHSDVLWDGTTLYVASHLFVNDGLPSQANFPTRLFRYTYNLTTKKYVVGRQPDADQQPQDRDAGDRQGLHRPAVGHVATGQPHLRQPHRPRTGRPGGRRSSCPARPRCRWTTTPR